MNSEISAGTRGRRLWGMAAQTAEALEERSAPVMTAWDLFVLMRSAYSDAGRSVPPPHTLAGICGAVRRAGIIAPDRDYPGHWRVTAVADRPADDIVCLLDRFCRISHLSAMQRWGLTDRQPQALMLTRPDDKTAGRKVIDIMETEIPRTQRHALGAFRLSNVAHPEYVRHRPVRLHRSRQGGSAVAERGGFARVSTIGQTFLDTLRRPGLCGGMAHVLDVWDEHAGAYLTHIIAAVESAEAVVKCRAGHIIEERLGVSDTRVAAWRAYARRGGSSRLDPARPYAPVWSETWMISLNA